MKEFHVFGGSKGGTAKSLTASYTTQEFRRRGFEVTAIDCDEGNRTFSRHAKLDVELLKLVTHDDRLDATRFDELVARLLEDEPELVVVDLGQPAYEPFLRYMYECQILGLLAESGRETFLHVPITGGQPGEASLQGLAKARRVFGDEGNLVIWLNDHYGAVDRDRCRETLGKIADEALEFIHLEELPYFHKGSVEEMLERFLTFEEAVADPGINVVKRQRILQVQRTVSAALEGFMARRVTGEEVRCA